MLAAQGTGPAIELALGSGQLQAVAALPGLAALRLLLLPEGQLAPMALAVQILVLLAEPLLSSLIPDGRIAGRRFALLLERVELAFGLAQGGQFGRDDLTPLAAELGRGQVFGLPGLGISRPPMGPSGS